MLWGHLSQVHGNNPYAFHVSPKGSLTFAIHLIAGGCYSAKILLAFASNTVIAPKAHLEMKSCPHILWASSLIILELL
jgi:hypothetical protein